MKKRNSTGKVLSEIRSEAGRQLRGFPREAKGQLLSGWGEELFRQIFGHSPRRRRGNR